MLERPLPVLTMHVKFPVLALHPAHGANPGAPAVLLVKAADASAPEVHCAFYVPAIKDIAKNEEDAEYRPLLNVLNDTECDYERRSFEGKVVLMERCDNTSNDDIVQKAKSAKAAAIVMAYNEKRPVRDTITTIKKLDIIVAFVKNSTGRQIAQYEEKQANGTVMAKLFTRSTSLDWSFLVIWLIAVCTVMTGSYWSGITQYNQYYPKPSAPTTLKRPKKISKSLRRPSEPDRKKKATVSVGVPPEQSDFTESMADMEEEFTVPLSPKLVVMFVMHMSVMLLMLYYFYRYLVYFIVVLFALASAAALISCLEPLVSRINIGTSKVPNKFPTCFQTPMEVRQVALLAFGIFVAISWFLLRRNDTFGWILQDVLGIAFCINMLKSFHLPNLKLLSLLLSLLLIYDVFFVFITPFLRANRESVMVEVAKGGSVMETLPMVIKFPRIVRGPYQKCFLLKFSILGLGDILAPGLLLSYCHAFDLLALGKKFYFYISSASYGLGMVATFAALELMHNAQPALLYLVPFTIIPTVTTAWFKGHLFAIWNGVKLPDSSSRQQASDESKNPTPRSSPGNREVAATSSTAKLIPDDEEGTVNGAGKQQKCMSKTSEDPGGEGGSSKNGSLSGHEGEPLRYGYGHNIASGFDHATVAFRHRGVPGMELEASKIVPVRQSGMREPYADAATTTTEASFEQNMQCLAACVVGAAYNERPTWRPLQGTIEKVGPPSHLVLCHQGSNGFRRDHVGRVGPTSSLFPA
ncbi:signal peptide peptidase-like 2A [Dermacentor variabilis]|uniref:signal peptide peptidase-like 2A n=1 Tax=Dermacentor variabilis TaxID=34621 RepID=UPI003F5BF419